MAGAAEAGTRNDQKIEFLGLLAEGDIIRDQCLREHVEGSLRLHAGEAQISEALHQDIPVRLIYGYVACVIRAHSADSLEQARRAYIAQGA